MQPSLLRRRLLTELGSQQVPNQGVVLVRLVPLRRTLDERTCLGQSPERPLGVARAGEVDGETGRQAVYHARLEQEGTNVWRLGVQHLRPEVGGDVARGQRRQLGAVVRARPILERCSGEPQAGRPTLGAVGEGENGAVGQVSVMRFEERLGLTGGEREVREPDLGHRTLEPVPVQRQVRVDPGDDDRPQLASRVPDDEVDLLGDPMPGKPFDVVQDQHDRFGPF